METRAIQFHVRKKATLGRARGVLGWSVLSGLNRQGCWSGTWQLHRRKRRQVETRVRHFLSNTCSTKINLLHAFACNHFAKRVPGISLSLSNFRGIKSRAQINARSRVIIFIDLEKKLSLLLTSGLKYLYRDKIILKCAYTPVIRKETVKRTVKQHVLGKF